MYGRVCMGRVENIVGKGENAGYQHFLLLPTMFSKAFHLGGNKTWNSAVTSYRTFNLLSTNAKTNQTKLIFFKSGLSLMEK